MAISRVNVVATSNLNASAITAAAPNTIYEGRATFDPAIYTITCASGTITNFQFLSGVGTILTTGVTSSGTVAINLASTADRIRLWTNTGTNIVVTITRTAAALTDLFGTTTLDTISTVGSSTYTGTSTSGWAYAVLVGGGGSGGGGGASNSGAGGGGSGGVGGKLVQLTGSMPVFIGSGGAQVNGNTNGNAGTASTFGGMTAGGGGGGLVGTAGSGAGGTVTGADISSSAGGGGSGGSTGIAGGGGTTTNFWPFVINGTTGGGGGAGGNMGPANGGGSGIGTGARGEGGTATGYGSGGGGGYGTSGVGTAGRPGVLYILKF